jgi:uncharacterized protein YgfB (UPF0149 family)
MGHTMLGADIAMTTAELHDQLSGLFAEVQAGATTKPVSVTLPAPMADAFKLLAELGEEENVSAAVTDALLTRLQSTLVGLRLDMVYEAFPDARPSEEEVAEMAARLGVTLP